MLSLDEFARKWKIDPAPLAPVARRYPFGLNAYFEGLIRESGDGVWRQVVPDPLEMSDFSGFEDPLAEEALSPAPNLVHRYPNRVLWLVSNQCALNCRFCTRKRRWGRGEEPQDLKPALDYIAERKEIVDVLLSGGDPLLLPQERLYEILRRLREIEHVQIIRIGSRVPCALPSAITPGLAQMLSGFHPLYVNIHFNHPVEVTVESAQACAILANAGIPLASQTVLLRGVNDSHTILAELFHKLLSIRVRPYYLMQMDLTAGTAHFRTPLSTGLKVLRMLRNRISGLAMPHFVIDLPGGRGKMALLPNMIREINAKEMIVGNYTGETCIYPLLEGEQESLQAEAAAGAASGWPSL
ncbi:MAG: KamA family radical SAM protein [Syntrophobacteraceae bacterium]